MRNRIRPWFPQIFSGLGLVFQRAEGREEYLSKEEHVRLAINAYSGIVDALRYIQPYLEQYAVIPVRFEFGGSIVNFKMMRTRPPGKFFKSLQLSLRELVWEGVISQEFHDILLREIDRLLGEGVPVEQIPKQIQKTFNPPRPVIVFIEEEVPSDIDTTLYLKSAYGLEGVEGLIKRLMDEIEYSPKLGTETSLYDRISEIASEKTKPHPLWVKLEPEL